MSVVEIRKSAPLTDIAGHLRRLADDIESGKIKPDQCALALRFGEFLHRYSFGRYSSVFEVNGMLLAAASGEQVVYEENEPTPEPAA